VIGVEVTRTEAVESALGTASGEQGYRHLFHNMMHGLAYCRMLFEAGRPCDFICLSANAAFEAQTGSKGVAGKRAREILGGIRESNPELLDICARVARGGPPESFETYVAALDTWFAVSVYSPEPEHFVALFEVITERKRHEAELERLAHYDPITDLPNRLFAYAHAEHALARARRRGGGIAILFLDLDGFKKIDDSHGHRVGERLLREAGRRLRERTRAEDILARVGGDELVVVMEDLSNGDDAAALAGSLNDVLRRPFAIEGREIVLTASIGIALYPGDGEDTHLLFEHADAAHVRAKQEGGDRYVFYTQGFGFQEIRRSSYAVEWAIGQHGPD
jgi:diguanylate cyclase (GGDEF)-like protein